MNARTALTIRDIEILFRPFIHRKIKLNSRLVMAPLSRNFATEGVPSPEMAHYYRRRATHELGLIISEGAVIDDPAAAADESAPAFFGGAALRAWKNICREVHATGCKIIPQLTHVGMARPTDGSAPNPNEAPIGPSGIDPITLQQTAVPMSPSRIRAVIDSYGRAAAHARNLGFDGVEIQGGQGSLVDQFLRAATNHRDDEYGGDIPRRVRFACEVVHAVRKAVGSRLPVIFRLSQESPAHDGTRLARSADELAEYIIPLTDAGVDIFDCSSSSFHHAEFSGNPRTLAGWVRFISGKPVISTGGVGLPGAPMPALLQLLMAEEFDLIAVGRALVADHAWAEKVHSGRESDIIPFSLHSFGRLL